MKKRKTFQLVRDLKIRTKLLMVYAVLFLVTVATGSISVYLAVKENIRQSMENELANTSDALRNMVHAAATTAVKTHLRGISEAGLKDVHHFYSLYKSGEMTESEAKNLAGIRLLTDVIGKTGYIFVWDVSRAPASVPLAVHPYIQGEDVAYVDFVQEGARLKEGYIEYDWKNPHETAARKKSMYLSFFKPWKWVIAAASYREEFLDLVDIADFKAFITPLKFGESGYSFIFDINGDTVIHPTMTGNLFDAKDTGGRYFIREMCFNKNGVITYSWQEPGNMKAREKLTAYRHIPEYDWIVASSSYHDEIYAPLRKLSGIIAITAILSMVIVLPLMFWLSSLLSRQLTNLVKGFARGSAGDLSVRIVPKTTDEIGQLTLYFNAFMEKLEEYHISLRKEMDEKIKTASRLEVFGKFAQAAGQGFFMTDLDGRITYANPAMCHITGCAAPEELIGRNIFDYYENVFKDILDKQIRPVLRRKNTWMGELVFKADDGREIDIIQNVFLIRDNLGKARLFATVITDITERKRIESIIQSQKERIQDQYAELETRNLELVDTHKRLVDSNLALSREKELLAITLRSIADGVITTDTGGFVTLMNHTAEIIAGVKAADAVGKSVGKLFELVNEKDAKVIENPAMTVINTGTIAIPMMDYLIVGADGSTKYVIATAAPIYDAEQSLSGAVLVLRDVTERRKMEKELIKSMKIESLGIFAGGLAHDFNNLLMAVMGNISLASRLAKDDKKMSSILNDALNASLSARELTQQLLTFSRGGEPVLSVESLGELVVRAADFIMSGSDIQMIYDIEENLWSGIVDKGQFNQVIYNIVLNARQAMADGGTLTCAARNFSYVGGEFPMEAGKYVRIDITDSGPGVAPEILKNIFDPFFTTKENGSGLGLAIAFSIVQKHGGHISLESIPGKGCVFSIYMPASTEKAVTTPAEPVADGFGKGMILVMDDDRTVADIAMLMLMHLGFDADWAKDGTEALEKYAAALDNGNPYRAVIMDLTIPGGMGGLEAVKQLKKRDPTAVVFVSSGYSNDPVVADYRDHGFDGVLNKPYLYEDLANILRRHLG
ncbi:MAG: PAS domain S-box protein [Desulfobacteraceae bacterium]|jgi:PAS domain S-box-containing protein|nr:MAG: PAS domain S-box protein [Desulfobacteraceae bacterium]